MGVDDAIAQEVLYKDTVAQEVLYMNYLSVRPLVLSNTLSHIWDRLNLPMLLFKEGLLTRNLARNIKDSIYIRVNNPSLNNNIGKFNLSHIWDRVLLNTKGLTLK